MSSLGIMRMTRQHAARQNMMKLSSFVSSASIRSLPVSSLSSPSPSSSSFKATAAWFSSWSAQTVSTLPPVPPHCHRMVLMRHGESEFNNTNVFTGWCDVALTQRGVVEAVEAGQVFRSQGLTFRKCYVSLLTRSIVTAHRVLEETGCAYTPLEYDFRWNERHYGALQGLSKERTAIRLGRERVMEWRRSYVAKPPMMTIQHPHYYTIQNDARYSHLRKDEMPLGESLEDCQRRVIQAWDDMVRNDIMIISKNNNTTNENHDNSSSPSTNSNSDNKMTQKYNTMTKTNHPNNYSLLVAHANSLRALIMYLDDITNEDIEELNIPTAIPFYYDIDTRTGQIVRNESDIQHVGDFASTKNHEEEEDDDDLLEGTFRGIFITDERKQRSFLERRRAANDPWLWALHDHQVATSLLNGTTTTSTTTTATSINGSNTLATDATAEVMSTGTTTNDDEPTTEETTTIEEARINTELFSPGTAAATPPPPTLTDNTKTTTTSASSATQN